MALNKVMRKVACLAAAVLTFFVLGCTVSYKFTGASIDYTRVKTVSLETFQNRAAYQWGPMSTMFNEAICSWRVKLQGMISSTSRYRPTAILLWCS